MRISTTSVTLWGVSLSLLAFVMGCGGSSLGDAEGLVASYKEKQLTQENIRQFLPEGVAAKDSARIANAYVKQWLKEQAIMDEALSNYSDLAEEVEAKVEDYRAKLIMHSYQSRLIEESLEKNVSRKEVLAFYEANKSNFNSKENLYNYFYVVTKNRDRSDPSKWIKSSDPADQKRLLEWSKTNALEFKLDSTFVNEAIINHVSKGYYGNLKKSDPGKLIRWTGVIKGENRYYLFKMVKVVNVGEPLTLDQCKDKIRDIILNERKISMIEKNEERILKNAKSNNIIREYE